MSPSSVPVFHYLDLGRLGRGEVLLLFLKDAGVEVKDIRYPYDSTWPATSEKLKQQGLTKTGKLPVLEYNGLRLSQHIPTLRYLARELGSYDGESSVDKFTVDVVADLYIDWRVDWVSNISGPSDEFKAANVKYYDTLSKYYDETAGPYLLGDRITYADFAVYQSIDNDERIGSLPPALPDSLVKLVQAIEARPNISAYIKENKKA